MPRGRKRKSKGERKVTYYATYHGPHKKLKYTGIKDKYVIPGKRYEVTESIAQLLKTWDEWGVEEEVTYI